MEYLKKPNNFIDKKQKKKIVCIVLAKFSMLAVFSFYTKNPHTSSFRHILSARFNLHCYFLSYDNFICWNFSLWKFERGEKVRVNRPLLSRNIKGNTFYPFTVKENIKRKENILVGHFKFGTIPLFHCQYMQMNSHQLSK